jgi:hypothetical protein
MRAVSYDGPAMPRHPAIEKLVQVAGAFGPSSAAAKLRLLGEIAHQRRYSARDLLALHDALCFLHAYPDNARVLRAVESVAGNLREWLVSSEIEPDSPVLVDQGFPGSVNHPDMSLPLLRRMRCRYPDSFEIDWDNFEDQDTLVSTLGLLATSGECQGLDDISLDLDEWFDACRPANQGTDLEFLLTLFAYEPLDGSVRDRLYESCNVPVRYELGEPGTGRAEIVRPVDRIHYQKRALHRRRSSLTTTVRRPFPVQKHLGPRAGEEFVLLGQRALCARDLEIRTLSHANAEDVWLVDGGRGLKIALIGVVPEYRDPLECHYCCLVLKNGVPIAYGPGTVSFGCCEIGINFFPEFRGAEVGYIYPLFLRALYQVLGARYFFLTPYGMGVNNPAAIRTGAFWFYRKLGFVPANPEVEELARQEEARTARNPRHRSSRATLRRLSNTSVFFDLSRGEYHPLDFGSIGMNESRFIAEAFDGDRRRAVERCISKVSRLLGQSGVARLPFSQRHAWEMLAPILAMIPGLTDWSGAHKKRMLRILRAKGGSSEHNVDRLLLSHAPFRTALRNL